MNEQQTPTPKTDAFCNNLHSNALETVRAAQELRDFARKLERERNEARARVTDLEANNRYQRGYAAGEKSVEAELTQLCKDNETFRNAQKSCADCDAATFEEVTKLRKVCNDLAEDLTSVVNTKEKSTWSKSLALQSYSTLPHVIKAKGTK